MIDIKDLRLGNCICGGGILGEVIAIMYGSENKGLIEVKTALGVTFVDPERVDPIPITMYNADFFGLEKKFKGGASYDIGNFSVYFDETMLSGKHGRTYYRGRAVKERAPRYVHELQNIVHALTGKDPQIPMRNLETWVALNMQKKSSL